LLKLILFRLNPDIIIQKNELIMVTGSNGFVGTRVVATLLSFGHTKLRCFVRPSSRTEDLKAVLRKFEVESKVEVFVGDLLSREDCARATNGVSVIYHLAAGFDKSFAGAYMNSALATRNLLDAFASHGTPKRFVNVSSFAVYSNLQMKRGAVLDETSPLEDSPQERFDAYGFGKLKQEEIVREMGSSLNIPFVVLRPGTIYGPGKRDLTGRIGIDTFGFFIHIGGSNRLPMTYVENCAEAIVLAGLRPGIDGETFNVVDDETLTSRQFLRAYKQRAKPMFSIWLPYFCASGLSTLWENYSKWSKGQLPPAFNRRRCAAEWKGNRYSNEKIRRRLGWTPRVDVKTAMSAFLAQFEQTPR
jgi:nucleoside-diphosphate-sugar epimerase